MKLVKDGAVELAQVRQRAISGEQLGRVIHLGVQLRHPVEHARDSHKAHFRRKIGRPLVQDRVEIVTMRTAVVEDFTDLDLAGAAHGRLRRHEAGVVRAFLELPLARGLTGIGHGEDDGLVAGLFLDSRRFFDHFLGLLGGVLGRVGGFSGNCVSGLRFDRCLVGDGFARLLLLAAGSKGQHDDKKGKQLFHSVILNLLGFLPETLYIRRNCSNFLVAETCCDVTHDARLAVGGT